MTPDGIQVTGEGIYEADNECTQAYPVAGDPRRAAGQDLRATTAKCALVPLDRSDLPDGFTDEHVQRLRAVFPDGVCDWSRPGVGEVGVAETWISYGP
jgi:hypothetical protein